jgi:hypothetical protein
MQIVVSQSFNPVFDVFGELLRSLQMKERL